MEIDADSLKDNCEIATRGKGALIKFRICKDAKAETFDVCTAHIRCL
jgi:hypothetical protein